MKNLILRLLGLTPDLEPKLEYLSEKSDHLRKHIIIMESKLEKIEQSIEYLIKGCNK